MPLNISQRHPWDVSPVETIAIQQQLRGEVEREDRLATVRHVAGVDVGFEEGGAITRYRLPGTTRWAHRLASGPAV